MSFLPYAKQSMTEGDLQAVREALQGELITRGPAVQLFEQTIANYCQVPYAVAFNSGTAALMAAYFAAQLSSFDRVLTTPNTFIATIGAPVQKGIHLDWIDIHRSTGNFDLQLLDHFLNIPSTQGRLFIIPVHFTGIAMDMAALKKKISCLNPVIIEDAAHALGSSYPSGEKVGSCTFSEMTIFSFHPAKTLTTGEGGMVTTRDPEFYHRLKLFRDNGIERTSPYVESMPYPGYYEVQVITGNFNFTTFQAALGLSQFKRLESFILQRRLLVKCYRDHLNKVPHVTLLTDEQDDYTAFHLFVVQIDFKAYHTTREKVMHALKEKGIGSQVHYIPLYYHPILKDPSIEQLVIYPQTEVYYQQALSLPLYFDLTKIDVDRICQELISILNSNIKF